MLPERDITSFLDFVRAATPSRSLLNGARRLFLDGKISAQQAHALVIAHLAEVEAGR